MPRFSADNNTGCCGLRAVSGLNDEVAILPTMRNNQMEDFAAEYVDGSSYLTMVTANDYQLSDDRIRGNLMEAGFRIVARWHNISSQRWVNLLVAGRSRNQNVQGGLQELLSRELRHDLDLPPIEAAPVTAARPAPVAPPDPRRWFLDRIRFDENGLVNERIMVNHWTREPAADVVARSIRAHRGEGHERWRYEVSFRAPE